MERTNSGLVLLVVFVLFALYFVPFYPEGRTRFELTDWATTAALVETSSFDLSEVKKSSKIELESVVNREGGIYSTKAPGLSLFSIPVYVVSKIFLGEPSPGNVKIYWNIHRLLLSALPLLMLGGWLYNREVDSFSLAALLFVTPVFAYSLFLYSHVIAALLAYMGFRLIYDYRRVTPETCFSAAFLLGVAVLCEYAVIVPSIVIGAGLLFTDSLERFRRMLFFASGLLPSLVLLVIQQYFVFGSPFAFVDFTSISYPSLEAIYTYSISPSAGLLFFSPLLIFGLFALSSPDSAGRNRFRVKILIILVTFLAVCGSAATFSGESAGPRYLIIIVPFLLDAFFDGEVEEYPSFWRGFLFSVSLVLTSVPLLSYPFAPTALSYPHNSFWIPLLTRFELYPATAAQFYGFAQDYWTAAPIGILLFAVLFFVWRDAKRRVPFGVGLAGGIAIVCAYLFAFSLESGEAAEYLQEVSGLFGR
ncbi:MAG: hypothetical protein HKN33_06120 [Pyrinomonadaceae bacterium]|nr:hypothetical protein [Pyrinomonadaceae bacterium]